MSENFLVGSKVGLKDEYLGNLDEATRNLFSGELTIAAIEGKLVKLSSGQDSSRILTCVTKNIYKIEQGAG